VNILFNIYCYLYSKTIIWSSGSFLFLLMVFRT